MGTVSAPTANPLGFRGRGGGVGTPAQRYGLHGVRCAHDALRPSAAMASRPGAGGNPCEEIITLEHSGPEDSLKKRLDAKPRHKHPASEVNDDEPLHDGKHLRNMGRNALWVMAVVLGLGVSRLRTTLPSLHGASYLGLSGTWDIQQGGP